MSPNKSLAVWCSARDLENTEPNGYEAHFNFWHISGDENFCIQSANTVQDFLEVGVLLDAPHLVSAVCIFVPHRTCSKFVSDCSKYFRTASLAQAIFNEVLDVSIPADAGARFIELKGESGLFCRVHQFMRESVEIDSDELELRPFAGGTLLTITSAALATACRPGSGGRVYFRLRLLLEEPAKAIYVRRVPIPDRLMQSGFDEIEYIDFRLNEARTLPAQIDTIMREDRANINVKLTLVAFLTAVPVQSDLSVSNVPSHKLRLLEHELWSQYVENGIPEGMIVYHWRRVEFKGTYDFSTFIRLQTRRSGRWTLLKYLAFAFVFGVLGNLCASLVETALHGVWNFFHSSTEKTAAFGLVLGLVGASLW